MTGKHVKELRLMVVLFFLGLGSVTSNAQEFPPGFYDDVDDEPPAAPIDGFIAVTLLAGTFLGGYVLKKKDK